jgi:hypothetical protein
MCSTTQGSEAAYQPLIGALFLLLFQSKPHMSGVLMISVCSQVPLTCHLNQLRFRLAAASAGGSQKQQVFYQAFIISLP